MQCRGNVRGTTGTTYSNIIVHVERKKNEMQRLERKKGKRERNAWIFELFGSFLRCCTPGAREAGEGRRLRQVTHARIIQRGESRQQPASEELHARHGAGTNKGYPCVETRGKLDGIITQPNLQRRVGLGPFLSRKNNVTVRNIMSVTKYHDS